MLDSRRVAGAALLLLPAVLLLYFAFNSGGFDPGPPAYVAIVLCVVLLLRVTMAGNPFEGASRRLSLAVGAMALYTLLTLLSESWSHSPGHALIEFDWPLVYLLATVLFGSVAHSRERLTWILRALAMAIVLVCICGLITRVLPHVWPTTPGIANNRLSFPVSYWNVLGLLAALGLVLCLHFSSESREVPAARVASAAAIPILATTLFFTFSRGSILATVVAVVTYVLLGRPRLLLSGLIAVVPPTAVALIFAYDANLLATPDPTTASAVVQGHHVAVAVGLCVLAAGTIRLLLLRSFDDRLESFTLPPERRQRIVRAAWGSVAAAAVIAIVALSGTIVHQYHRFTRPGSAGSTADLRTRLTDPGNNGRLEMWHVAWHQFKSAPVLGHGAGTFQNAFAQHRMTDDFVLDAHSLYMETLDELGVIGFLLLTAVIVMFLVAAARRVRGPTRPLYAALFAILLAWALETGIDWDWEMPVVTLPFFALGGFVLAGPVNPPARTSLAPQSRTLLGLGCILLAVAPTYVWLSQRKLAQAVHAFSQRDCITATRTAISSISTLGIRPEPYEILGFCDIRRDMPHLAVAAINRAVSLDPDNWNYRYGLALVRAAAGLDPRPAAGKALSLNPRDTLVQNAWNKFRRDSPAQWQADGKAIASQFTRL